MHYSPKQLIWRRISFVVLYVFIIQAGVVIVSNRNFVFYTNISSELKNEIELYALILEDLRGVT